MPTSPAIDKFLPVQGTAVVTETPAHTVASIELLEETVHVGKRLVESGRTKVHVTVSERDEVIETLLMRQDLVIDRVSFNQPVEAAPPVRQEGDTIIVSLVEERVVVEKRLFLTEELRFRIDQTQRMESQTVRLRREQAEVDEDGLLNLPNTEGSAL